MRAALRDHLPHAARCGRKALLFWQQQLAWFARDCCQPARFAAHDSQKPATGVRAQEPRQQRGSPAAQLKLYQILLLDWTTFTWRPQPSARRPQPQSVKQHATPKACRR